MSHIFDKSDWMAFGIIVAIGLCLALWCYLSGLGY